MDGRIVKRKKASQSRVGQSRAVLRSLRRTSFACSSLGQRLRLTLSGRAVGEITAQAAAGDIIPIKIFRRPCAMCRASSKRCAAIACSPPR